MPNRDETIARLEALRNTIRADLTDEAADRQVTAENAVVALTFLISDLKADAEQNATDAATLAGGIDLILNLAYPNKPLKAIAECDSCGGCKAGDACIGAFILEDHKACQCAPVAAQTDN